jgi:hypothetical protein
MSGVQFFQTRMGQRFYEHTMPELVRQLTRFNDLLEQGVTRAEDGDDHEAREADARKQR